MKILSIYNQLAIFFLIMIPGYIMRKKGLISQEVSKGLARVLVNIALPALIITSLSFEINQQLIADIKVMTILSFLIYIGLILIAEVIAARLPARENRKTIFKLSLVLANTLYMGLPLITVLYPENGILFVMINNLFFNLALWTYGVYILSKDNQAHGNFKLKKLLNSGLIAMMVAILLNIFQLDIGPFYGALERLGQMTFPLSMLVIGSSLANIEIKTVFRDKLLYYILLLKLIALPLIGLFLFRVLNLPLPLSNISIILLGMPAGTNTVIFAEKYDGDYTLAAKGVFLTTLFSIITLPLLVWLIGVI